MNSETDRQQHRPIGGRTLEQEIKMIRKSVRRILRYPDRSKVCEAVLQLEDITTAAVKQIS